MNKAYKFRIYPNNEQQVLITKTFGCVRFVYNKMLGDKIDLYEKFKEDKEQLKINKPRTYTSYKAEFDWLKEVDNFSLVNAKLNLETAYKNFFRDKGIGFPKFKSKHKDKQSYTTNITNNNIRIENGYIKLPKLGFVKIKQHRTIPMNYNLKSATISKTPTGKYYVSILFEYEKEIIPVKPNNVIGLDFSMKELFISSEGIGAEYPKYYRKALEKLGKEQRKLSKCKVGSNNRKKQRLQVAKLHEHISNQRKDFLHKLSKQITNVYDCVCIENLNMKDMSSDFGKSVSDNSFGMFRNMLAYKLQEQGEQLIVIDKWFPSSKKCSCCGNVKETLSLSERTYHCDCGFVLDRDINAAINIKNEGIRTLSLA